MSSRRATLLAMIVWGAAVSAAAQTQTVEYGADFFSPFAPRTALDMVERVPGFMIDAGEERRGFVSAQGNVLIDGQPPASKAQDIEDVLAGIPASEVVRIELLRGTGVAAGSGQAVRVNIVRRPSSGEGVWEIGLAQARDERVSPSGEASWSGRRGNLEYGLTAALEVEHLPIRGVRTDFDSLGALEETRRERVPTDEREGRLSAEATLPWLGGALTLTAQLIRIELDERERGARFSSAGDPAGSVRADLFERDDTGEVAAAYRREFGVWRGELGAVITRRRFDGEELSVDLDVLGGFDESAQQFQRIDSGETILRGTAQRALGEAWRIEASLEAALNTLEQRLRLTEDDGGGPAPVTLPSANVRVEETRGEAALMIAGAPAPRWSLEAGAAVETSVLTQNGDVSQETELTYIKPSLQITRALGERNQVRLRFYRDVGQLDFEDFVSAADITSAIVDGGNPDLRPETSWRLEAAGDWRFGDDGALSLTLYRWWVEDALDIVPVGPGGDQVDAPGNIGDAEVVGLRAALSLPLPFDAELRVEGLSQQSEATDPLTGEMRSISGFDESLLTVELRQDVEALKVAWGIEFEREREAPSWRLDRIERERDADELTLWVETTAFADVKLRAWASNLSDSDETRRRRIFDPNRLGALDSADDRARSEGVTIGVSASGAF